MITFADRERNNPLAVVEIVIDRFDLSVKTKDCTDRFTGKTTLEAKARSFKRPFQFKDVFIDSDHPIVVNVKKLGRRPQKRLPG